MLHGINTIDIPHNKIANVADKGSFLKRDRMWRGGILMGEIVRSESVHRSFVSWHVELLRRVKFRLVRSEPIFLSWQLFITSPR